ncbi:MAG: nuclear transport factor 2 family protein [Actinobacteria bacterium]|nr:nuclear transport factor 2 family protein [Actinomycetota bacterium]
MSEASDRSEIERVLNLYIEGVKDGDAAKLGEAFHPDALMFGAMGGKRLDKPIADWIAASDGAPADTDGTYTAKITSVEAVEDTAIATVAEDGFKGIYSFLDFFALARVDGDWKIVNKTFAHTGGDLPS